MFHRYQVRVLRGFVLATGSPSVYDPGGFGRKRTTRGTPLVVNSQSLGMGFDDVILGVGDDARLAGAFAQPGDKLSRGLGSGKTPGPFAAPP